MKATLTIDQVAQVLIRHLLSNQYAFCLPDDVSEDDVVLLEWTQTTAGSPPALVTITINKKKTP